MAQNKLSRRDFILRCTKAGISAAAAAVLAGLLYEADPAKISPQSGNIVEAMNYSVPPIADKTMSIVTGSNRPATVTKAIELLGGMERFIKPGENVLLKPNAGFAMPPRICATTHPELITQVIKLCYQAGAKKVFIADNPINDPKSCFELSQIASAAQKNGAEILLPRPDYFKPITLKGAELIHNWPMLYKPLKKVDKVIGIAIVKDHRRSIASMSMKNWYGLLGGNRSIFHQDINKIIVELAMLIRPTLVILDGTETMVSNGPTGGSESDLKQTNTMIASCDQVAADSFGASLLGLKPEELPYLVKAEKLGLGTTDYQSLKPLYTQPKA
ncbi:MAG: DUF362 domain-containing protein [Phycisphaerae bacterium]|jgi:uncharacterized protein (DUF362 family)